MGGKVDIIFYRWARQEGHTWGSSFVRFEVANEFRLKNFSIPLREKFQINDPID